MALSHCVTTTNQQGWETTEHGTPPFPIACYHNDLSEAAVPCHWHDELEATVVEAGGVVVTADSEVWELEAGQGYFFPSGVLHGIRQADAPSRIRAVVFHPRLVGGSVESVFWQNYLQPLISDGPRCVRLSRDIPWQKEALEAVETSWLTCVEEPRGFEFTVREALSRLVFLLSSHCPAVERRPSEKALRDGERIKAMLRCIQERCADPLTVAEIAASASISESECLRCFRSMIGATPIQYVKQLRVQRAAELLESSDEKISEIGMRCGFQEMSYFARTFRALKGRTPSQYRAEKRAAE